MKRGKRVLGLVLCLGLVCALAAPAKAAKEVEITWLPEGVIPQDASCWSVKGEISSPMDAIKVSPRDVKRGDLIAVERNREYGYVDLSGELVVPFTRTSRSWFFFSDGLLPVLQWDSDENLTGTNYVDKTGKTVLELGDKFWGMAFSDGVALVTKLDDSGEAKIGAIDTKGNTVVPYEYDDVFDNSYGFVGGFAKLEKKNSEGEWEKFFVSANGKTVIPISEYDEVRHFSEGLAAVSKDGKGGYIDTAGNLKIPFEYDYYGSYFDGNDSYMEAQNGMVVLRKDGKCGYASTKGEIVIPLEYKSAEPFGQDGLAWVRPEGEDSYILIDKNGKKVDKVSQSVGEKLAAEGYEFSAVRRSGLIYITKDKKHGFADEQGEIVIPAEYSVIWGYPSLFLALKGKYGFINKKGEVVVPFEFGQRVDLIMNGYIGVVYQNGRYGIFENPYYEEPKPAGLFSFGSSGPSASGGLSPLLPVAAVAAVALLGGGFVLLKKKRR